MIEVVPVRYLAEVTMNYTGGSDTVLRFVWEDEITVRNIITNFLDQPAYRSHKVYRMRGELMEEKP